MSEAAARQVGEVVEYRAPRIDHRQSASSQWLADSGHQAALTDFPRDIK